MRKFIFLSIVLFSALFLKAQDTTIYIVSGKIIDAETLLPVSMVYLLNVTKRFGAQTDTSGKFRILLMKGDKIRISSIGYSTDYWEPDFSKATGNYIRTTIYIVPKTYNIGAVDIYSTRWSSFLYEASQVEIAEDETQKNLIKWVDNLVDAQNLSSQNLKGGIQIVLPLYTHREKMLRKIEEQKKIDQLNKQANDKFNKDFVAGITNLSGQELDNFMGYCHFDRDFILRTSEYDLIVIVQDIYKEYEQNQN